MALLFFSLLYLKIREIYMLYYEKNTGERSEYNTWWGLYNTFKSVLCYRLNYSSCVPLGVTDFVRTSSQEKVDGDIYTFFSFIFNSRELQGVLWETDSYMRSPWWGPKACRGSNPTLFLFLFLKRTCRGYLLCLMVVEYGYYWYVDGF